MYGYGTLRASQTNAKIRRNFPKRLDDFDLSESEQPSVKLGLTKIDGCI